MTTVSYRSFTGTAAENYERYFVPKIARPVSVAVLEAAALQSESPTFSCRQEPAAEMEGAGRREHGCAG
jgi:hypothetical protein